jgi:hypothetical protein
MGELEVYTNCLQIVSNHLQDKMTSCNEITMADFDSMRFSISNQVALLN